jgi:hypothetical protein
MGETRILIRFFRYIFHGTGDSARLCQNFGIIFFGGGGLNPPNPPTGYASAAEGSVISRWDLLSGWRGRRFRQCELTRNGKMWLKNKFLEKIKISIYCDGRQLFNNMIVKCMGSHNPLISKKCFILMWREKVFISYNIEACHLITHFLPRKISFYRDGRFFNSGNVKM